MNQGAEEGESALVAEAWRQELKAQGYESLAVTARSCLKFRLLSRSWRRILRHTGLGRFRPVRALEFGCGGGVHLVPLFANGWDCTGVDCSEEVLARAHQYVEAVRKGPCPPRGHIAFVCRDFIDLDPGNNLYDLTFQFGVLEHFLNDKERMRYVQKMFDVTRPGGFVVSAVPNGCHAIRQAQREKGLGGYRIPEIDYSSEQIEAEMKQCGASEVKVLAHDLYGYLRIRGASGIRKIADHLVYYTFQVPLFQLMPASFLSRHAYWWLAVARKSPNS